MSFSEKYSVRGKIYLMVACFVVGFAGYALWTTTQLRTVAIGGPQGQRVVQSQELVASLSPPGNYIIEAYALALHVADDVEIGATPEHLDPELDRFAELKSDFYDNHQRWLTALPESDLKRLKTIESYKPAVEFFKVIEGPFLTACRTRDAATVNDLVRGPLAEHFASHRAAARTAAENARQYATEIENASALFVFWRSIAGIVAAVSVIAGMLIASVYTAAAATAPLRAAAAKISELSTERLRRLSNELSQNASNTSEQATRASDAAEQVSANAQSLSGAVEQFELSIREIAGNASNAASVARSAVDATDQTNGTISRLGESSREIGEVIQVINSIAEQTNLLALNATIEAARAGDAGKGFAVVANEVQDLAQQTSKATEEIIKRINAIQSETTDAVDAIGRVSQIISDIDESQNAIAGAVEQQTAMTTEISQNIAQVATGSSEIARNISVVANAAKSTTEGSTETLSTASEFEDVAEGLFTLLGEVRNAASGSEAKSIGGKRIGKYQLT